MRTKKPNNFHCVKGDFSWIRTFIVLRNIIFIYIIYIYIYIHIYFHALTKNLVLYFSKNVFCINIWNLYLNDWRAVTLYNYKVYCIFVVTTNKCLNGYYFFYIHWHADRSTLLIMNWTCYKNSLYSLKFNTIQVLCSRITMLYLRYSALQ